MYKCWQSNPVMCHVHCSFHGYALMFRTIPFVTDGRLFLIFKEHVNV